MTTEINIVLIDPENKMISSTTIDGTLESLQHAIGDKYIELVAIDDENIMYVDEEGMFSEFKHFFKIDTDGGLLNIAGKAIVLGNDIENGESISTKLTAVDVSKIVEFQ